MTTTTDHPHPTVSETATPERRFRPAAIARSLWPAALAIAMSVATWGGSETGEGVRSLAQVLALLPLMYLVVETFQWRRATWPLLALLLVSFIALETVHVVAPATAIAGAALAALVWGAAKGRLFRSRLLQAQALAMIGFGAIALAGLVVAPDAGRYLVAAGWFAHGLWDVVHLKRDKVVLRSYALWCAVVDLIIAAQLAFAL